MIRKLIRNTILATLILGSGWYLFHFSEIGSFQDAWSVLQKDGNRILTTLNQVSFGGSEETGSDRLKIASFDLEDFSDAKLDEPRTGNILAAILSRFDVIAIQGIQSPDHDTLPRLMDTLRQIDPGFDYVIGPRSSHTAMNHQFAFIYNRRTVALEREHVYTIQDPDDIVAHDPLVGWFRAINGGEDSFTFTLVNIRIDPTNKQAELRYLHKIQLAVKADGHQEDDVLLVGNFQENSITMQNSKTLPGCDFVIRQDTTDLMAQRQISNIAFPVQATAEFTGRTGVFDFLTELNLSVEEARKVSPNLPVWGEFFVTEGAASGYVASISQ